MCTSFKITFNLHHLEQNWIEHTDNNFYVRGSLQLLMFIALWISI